MERYINCFTYQTVTINEFLPYNFMGVAPDIDCVCYTRDTITPAERTSKGAYTKKGKREFIVPKYVFDQCFEKI